MVYIEMGSNSLCECFARFYDVVHFVVCCKFDVTGKQSNNGTTDDGVHRNHNLFNSRNAGPPENLIYEEGSIYYGSSGYERPIKQQPTSEANTSGIFTTDDTSFGAIYGERKNIKSNFTCEVRGVFEIGGIPKVVKGTITFIDKENPTQADSKQEVSKEKVYSVFALNPNIDDTNGEYGKYLVPENKISRSHNAKQKQNSPQEEKIQNTNFSAENPNVYYNDKIEANSPKSEAPVIYYNEDDESHQYSVPGNEEPIYENIEEIKDNKCNNNCRKKNSKTPTDNKTPEVTKSARCSRSSESTDEESEYHTYDYIDERLRPRPNIQRRNILITSKDMDTPKMVPSTRIKQQHMSLTISNMQTNEIVSSPRNTQRRRSLSPLDPTYAIQHKVRNNIRFNLDNINSANASNLPRKHSTPWKPNGQERSDPLTMTIFQQFYNK